MPNAAVVERIRSQLPDDAHVQMFDDALKALAGDNRLRAQHFAISLRELIKHALAALAPNSEVLRCAWFKLNQGATEPTRRQRALYLSQGGLSDKFISETLELDPDEFHEKLKSTVDEISLKVHIGPDTVLTEPDKIEEFADQALASLDEAFGVIDEVRSQIVTAIESNLQNEAAWVFIQETIQNLGIIAGTYTTEGVLFDEAAVVDIDASFIHYRVTGTVDVELHFGGKTDAAEIKETFPFTCTIVAKTSDPFKFLDDRTEMEVDTSSWHGDGEVDQDA